MIRGSTVDHEAIWRRNKVLVRRYLAGEVRRDIAADLGITLACLDKTLQRLDVHRPPPEIVHGASRYKTFGCRCDVCRAGNARAKARWVANKKSQLRRAPHGTAGGYSNWKCRCAKCKAAGSKDNRQRRLKRAAA